MLKGRGHRNGREALVFGLSFENLKRLREDKPIVVWGEEMGVPFDIVIFAGETEETMAKQVASYPNTIIERQPRRAGNSGIKTDWKLLDEQKRALIQVLNEGLYSDLDERLEGLLSFIDTMARDKPS